MESFHSLLQVVKTLKNLSPYRFLAGLPRPQRAIALMPAPLRALSVVMLVTISAQLVFSVSPLSATEVIYGGLQESASATQTSESFAGALLDSGGIFHEIIEGEPGLNQPLQTGGAVVAGALFTPDAVPTTALRMHTVLPGDTLFSVAQQYQVAQTQLAKTNKLSDDPLIVGDHLVIPQSTASVTATASATAVRTTYLPKGFIWPAPGPIGPAHGRYGGRDIANKLGTPIAASADGTVIEAVYGYSGGYGNHVVVDHGTTGYAVITMSAHLTDFIVVPGQQVKQGEIIGYMGSTGNSTGPHVHFEVREKQ